MSERTGSGPPREAIGNQQWLADFPEGAPGACVVVTAVRAEQGAVIDVQVVAANSRMREHLGVVGAQVPGHSPVRADATLLDSLAHVLESGTALVQPQVDGSTSASAAMRNSTRAGTAAAALAGRAGFRVVCPGPRLPGS